MTKEAEYKKVIHMTDTGMATAKVFSPDMRRVMLKFFDGLFDKPEKRLQKAHKAADEHIKLMLKYEVSDV